MPLREDLAGLDIDWLYQSPLVGITRWHCCKAGAAKAVEDVQHNHVITLLHNGAFAVRGRRGQALLDATRAFFINAGEAYTTTHPAGGGDHGSSVVLSPEALASILATYDPGAAETPEAPFRRLSALSSPRAYLMQRRLLAQLSCRRGQRRPAREPRAEAGAEPLAIEELALRLADELLGASYPARQGMPIAHWAVEAAQIDIQRRLHERLSLGELARRLGISPFHLCHTFKRATGLSLARYTLRLRLRAGVERVLDGSADLTSVALDLGFSSHSHFTAAFRREFGVPPSRLRSIAIG